MQHYDPVVEPEQPHRPQPRVTVVVTCYQQAHLVTKALDSVARQTEPSIQLIISDDGSTDGAAELIREWVSRNASRFPFEVTFMASTTNRGLPAALNTALPHIRGEYFVVLNGDDWMEEERIALQATALANADESVGLSYCDHLVVDASGTPLAEQPAPTHGGAEGDVLTRVVAQTFIGMPVVMARTDVLGVIGPWDETQAADDFDFLLRTACHFRFAYLPATLLNYRRHAASMTQSRIPELARGRIRSLERLLGREAALDQVILERIEEQLAIVHGSREHRHEARPLLHEQLRRRPTRRLIRLALENHLRLPPQGLAFTTLRRSKAGAE